MATTNTLKDLIGAVWLECGDATGKSHAALSWEAVKGYLNWACKTVCRISGLKKESKNYTTVASQMEYNLGAPTFLRAVACEWNNIPMKELSYNRMLALQGLSVDGTGAEATAGDPAYFCIKEPKLVVFPPTLVAGKTMTLHFIAGSVDMVAATDIPFYGGPTSDSWYLAANFTYSALLSIEADDCIVTGAVSRVLFAMGRRQEGAAKREEFFRQITELENASGDIPSEDIVIFGDSE